MFCGTLVVPIIDNTNFERDLTASMAEAMKEYPKTNCVLVRRPPPCPTWPCRSRRASPRGSSGG